MKYLKLYETFYIHHHDGVLKEDGLKEQTLREICLELEDLGVDIRINIGADKTYRDGLYKNIVMFNFGNLSWSYIKEYLLRIKDYLDDDFICFLFKSPL